MSNTPIFDELWIEFIERGKFTGRMIGPPEAPKVFGLPVVEKPEPNMDETIVMEPVEEEAPKATDDTVVMKPVKSEAPKTMAALEVLVARVAEIKAEEKQHVFPIRNNDPLMKISATGTLNYFDGNRAA